MWTVTQAPRSGNVLRPSGIPPAGDRMEESEGLVAASFARGGAAPALMGSLMGSTFSQSMAHGDMGCDGMALLSTQELEEELIKVGGGTFVCVKNWI